MRLRIRVAMLVMLATGAPCPSSAQAGPAASHWAPVGGLHAGSPEVVSASIGAFRDIARGAAPTEWARSLFAVAEPGLHAGRLSLGLASSTGTLGTGWTLRATGLRLWHGDVATEAGIEGSLMALALGPRLGVFRRVDGGSGVHVTADFGFGL